MTLELGGKITIDCEKTKCSAELEFKLKVGISFAFSPVYPTLLMSLEEREIRCSSNILFSILITPIAFLRWRWQCESDFWKDPYGRWCDGHNRGALGKSYSPHCPLKVMSIKDDKKTLLVNLNVLVIQCSFTVVIIWSRLHRNLSRNLWYSKSFCFFFLFVFFLFHHFDWSWFSMLALFTSVCLSVCLCACALWSGCGGICAGEEVQPAGGAVESYPRGAQPQTQETGRSARPAGTVRVREVPLTPQAKHKARCTSVDAIRHLNMFFLRKIEVVEWRIKLLNLLS